MNIGDHIHLLFQQTDKAMIFQRDKKYIFAVDKNPNLNKLLGIEAM